MTKRRSCASSQPAASTSPPRTSPRPARSRSRSSHDPSHRAPDRVARLGHARRGGSRQPAADDDRTPARGGHGGRRDPWRYPDGPQARRRLRAVAVRHPAGRRRALPRIRARHRRGCRDGACVGRRPRPWPRRAGRTRHGTVWRRDDQCAATGELPNRSCGSRSARVGRPERAGPVARRRTAARRAARRARDRVWLGVGLAGAPATRRRPLGAGRSAARRGHRGDGVGRRRRRDTAARGARAQPRVVRRRPRRRDCGDYMATVKGALARAMLRLFAVQGSYDYERMLGVGVGVAEEPLLRDLGDGKYRPAVARGAHFFNAHPYLIGLAIGAAARAEHDGAPPDQVERLREALCGPLGSVGDRLVWAGWLPFLSALTLAAVALGGGWIAVVSFLIVYNIGHVALRWWALKAGWTHGARVSVALHHPVLLKATATLGPAMALAVGFALPITAQYLAAPFGSWTRLALALAAVVAFLMLRLFGDRLNGLRFALGLSALALIAG